MEIAPGQVADRIIDDVLKDWKWQVKRAKRGRL